MLQNGADLVRKMGNVFCFRVTNRSGQEGIWILDAKHGNGSVTFGGPGLKFTYILKKNLFHVFNAHKENRLFWYTNKTE